MRHGKKFNHLKRKAGHRKALLKNLSNALIEHKRINTTLAKAKALRRHIEPLITKAKTDTTHSRRVVFSYLQDKEAVKDNEVKRDLLLNQQQPGYHRLGHRVSFREQFPETSLQLPRPYAGHPTPGVQPLKWGDRGG